MMKAGLIVHSGPGRVFSFLALGVFLCAAAPAAEPVVPVSSGTSLTIFEQTGGIFETTFAVAEILDGGREFLTSAGEKYTVVSDGDYLTVSCLHDRSLSEGAPEAEAGRTVPTELVFPELRGHSVGNNIVAVRLDGNPDYPLGLWASMVVDYSLGGRGLAASRFNALGDPLAPGPWGERHYTVLGTGPSAITLGFSPLIVAAAGILDTPDWNDDLALYIRLPEGYSPAGIDFYSLELVRVAGVETAIRPLGWWNLEDYAGGLVLRIEFSRAGIEPYLLPGDNLLLLRGSLDGGDPLEARVILPLE
ncbi:MAG: hypothetical protein P9M08_10465 [Candidatus Erginobacter occultus]|nr:hypothetical protein [Candidatus Erginobacter occultus]